MKNFLIGCDPELFIYNRVSDNYISGHPYVPGTKEEPYLVQDGALQVDGTAVELNIDPCDNADDFVNRIGRVLMSANQFLPESCELRAKPVVTYGLEYYKQLPAEVKRVGCDPDRNAWSNGEFNRSPVIPMAQAQAGGHIHIGWTRGAEKNPQHRKLVIDLVKQLDFYVGCYSLTIDDDNQRLKGYGRPGCFRVKDYGLEYRTPSNVWVGNPETARAIFEQTAMAVERFRDGERLFDEMGMIAKDTLLDGDRETAKELIDAIC